MGAGKVVAMGGETRLLESNGRNRIPSHQTTNTREGWVRR